MMEGRTPRWLERLERHLGWLAIPNIAIIFVTLQALGFLMVSTDPVWVGRLALIPELVYAGQYWRLITFLALPVSTSPLFVILALWFLYFILNMIESQWGAFKTTFYTLVSILITIAFSMATGYPVMRITHFESTLFLAAASLFPEMQVSLFLVVPVKMKWLAWLTLGLLGLELVQGDWLTRLHLLAIYSNYFVFFGPAMLASAHQSLRRRNFRSKMRQ